MVYVASNLLRRILILVLYFAAALMKNTGILFANDANKSRVNGIVGNFHRLGITNSVITNYDGRMYPQVSTRRIFGKGLRFSEGYNSQILCL